MREFKKFDPEKAKELIKPKQAGKEYKPGEEGQEQEKPEVEGILDKLDYLIKGKRIEYKQQGGE